MLIQHEVSPYNTRRYGKPWAAMISFNGTKPVYEFTGLYSNGVLAFDAEPGEIVAIGQKDLRGKNTSNDWYVVREQGLSYLTGGKVEALQLWREREERADQNTEMLAASEGMRAQTPEHLLEVQAALVAALEGMIRSDERPAREAATAALALAKGTTPTENVS